MRRLVTFAWIALGLLALGLEFLGLASNVDDIPPLTQIVTAYVPAVITLGFVGWLLVHFVQSYRDRERAKRQLAAWILQTPRKPDGPSPFMLNEEEA